MATQIYRQPNRTDSGGIYEWYRYIGDVSEGLFFSSIVGILWTIIFIATIRLGASRAWTFSSLISMILSILLVVADLLSNRFMYLFIFMTAMGFVWLKLENAGQNV